MEHHVVLRAKSVRIEEEKRERLRGARADFDTVKRTLLAKFRSKDTWHSFKEARGSKEIYRSSVTRLQQRLTQDLQLKTTSKGAYLDPGEALPLYISYCCVHALGNWFIPHCTL